MQDTEQRRHDLPPEHQTKQKLSQQLQSLQDKNCIEDGQVGKENEQLIRAQAEMEDNGQAIHVESLVEAELDLKIRGLQPSDGREGSNVSQSNGSCFGSAKVEQFVTMGASMAATIRSSSSITFQ